MAIRRGARVPMAQGQMTAAVAVMLQPKAAPRKRRAKAATRPAARKTTRRKVARKAAPTKSAKKPARLVKGSAAAKRHMSKLRKMRKR